MDITFSLQNGQYIAEFKVTSEFNLHIEKGVGSIQMFQRTSGTFFDKVEDFKMNKRDVVYDFDSSSFIGEKTIKIVSEVEPTFAAVTTSGEVTEIKSQSKEVEVTSNGTMDITPDAGFSYLNSVKVKTNVATSGEGGSGMEYLDLRGAQGAEFQTLYYSSACKFIYPNGSNLIPTGTLLANSSEEQMEMLPYLVAVKIDFEEVYKDSGEPITVREKLEKILSAEQLASIPRITEEEFYNLNA